MTTQTIEETEVKSNWQPRWHVDVGHGCEVGITTDDSCFVVLCQDGYGDWKPSKHIPPAVAEFISSLVVAGRVPLPE